MKAADSSSNGLNPQRFRSLRSKVFLPFFLLIIALCLAAIWGTFHIAEQSFTNSADERLAATKEVVFREFKKQEDILQTYAHILQQFHALSEHFRENDEINILRDNLFTTLEDANISTAYFPPDIRGIIQQESLIALFDQVRRSKRARFRYSNEFGGVPVLVVAAPLYSHGKIVQIILLKTEMGEVFLRNVTESLNVSAALMTLDGRILAKSNKNSTDYSLSPAQINLLGTGKPLYIDQQTDTETERHLFNIIPLGSTDLVLLSLEVSLGKKTELQNATILQMLLIMFAIIILGTIFYFRRISSITQPVRELNHATLAFGRGNLNYRIGTISNDELGLIAQSFNQMAEQLENSYLERSSHDVAAALAHEETKTKMVLDKKDLERSQINEELSIIKREITALYQLNQAMTSSIELAALFDRILMVLNDILSCDHVVLLLHNPGESFLEVVRTLGLDNNVLDKIRFSFNQGVTGEAAQNNRMIYVKDLDADERNLSYHGLVSTRGSMISAPLSVKGRLIGIINLHKKKIDAFSQSEQKLIQAVANQTAIAIDNAQLIEKNKDTSNIDELTGLANRRHFQDILKREVAQARRFNSIFSIIMCDIDGFKNHKSTLGKIQSDAMLRNVAQLLLKNTRGIDLVSRFGNDQFIILLPKTSKQGSVSAAEKLRLQLGKEDFAKLIDTDQSYHISLSFGVTEFPGDSKNIYELLNLADRSLYAAKQDGGNCTVAWEGPAPGPE